MPGFEETGGRGGGNLDTISQGAAPAGFFETGLNDVSRGDEQLQSAAPAFSIDESMIDVQHDSPVPIHEQITSQLMAHIAKGVLKAGARLADYRTFAQELLANPQVVARAYADLEWAGVLEKHPAGGMEIARGADAICRGRLQDTARQRIRQAVRQGVECGLAEADICQAVDQALASPAAPPLTPEELSTSIKKPSHASSHRDSQGIQDLSRQKGPGSP